MTPLASCARPWIGAWSAYTVLGLVGYVVAAGVAAVVGAQVGLGPIGRLVAIIAPAIGFVIAVFTARAWIGQERIVFYQTAIAAWATAVVTGAGAGLDVVAISDVAIILIAICLAFGRVGCFHVACCYGRPARFGVRYSAAHMHLGFPQRLLGRPLLPIQLAEAAVSCVLAFACIAVTTSRAEGTATIAFVVIYALWRFPIELLRGDAGRPFLGPLSEAQWIAALSVVVAAVLRPSLFTLFGAVAISILLVTVAARESTGSRQLCRPRHLDEVDELVRELIATRSAGALITSAGIKLTAARLPDSRIDLLLSSDRLSRFAVERMATELYEGAEVVAGQQPDLFHVLVHAAHFTSDPVCTQRRRQA